MSARGTSIHEKTILIDLIIVLTVSFIASLLDITDQVVINSSQEASTTKLLLLSWRAIVSLIMRKMAGSSPERILP